MKKRLFAIGDIHGCFDQFRELLEKQIGLREDDTIILLGDYIDRGPAIKKVIDYILKLRNEGYSIITLRGNHEQMLLASIDSETNLDLWLFNRGLDTIESFGLSSINELDQVYVEFFQHLPYYHEIGDFLFVHGGFNDTIQDPFKDTHYMIWERTFIYRNPVFEGKTIIHGHRPVLPEACCDMVESGSRVIDIDTGCVYKDSPGYGKLTAIEVYSRKLLMV